MQIIISPAKKMNTDTDTIHYKQLPSLLGEAEELLCWMRTLSYEELKALWGCNEKIAELNYRRVQEMDLRGGLTPALISYEGIQYQHMAPKVFTRREWDYAEEHLWILSGFYGALRPLDGVSPYRLEMQAKAKAGGAKDLYDYWGGRLYEKVKEGGGVIVNLASKEYSKCIERYLKPEDRFLTCVFGEWKDGKVIQKGTQAKMARGEMVRFMAQNGIDSPEEMKKFSRLGYCFSERMSSEREYVFVRNPLPASLNTTENTSREVWNL